MSSSVDKTYEVFGKLLERVDVSSVAGIALPYFHQYDCYSLESPLTEIPSLKEAWNSYKSGDISGMVVRANEYWHSQTAPLAQHFLLTQTDNLRSEGKVDLYEHEATIDPDLKRKLLESYASEMATKLGLIAPIVPLRTVTLHIGDYHVLVSGTAEVLVTDDVKKRIASELGLANKKAKNAKVNSSSVDYSARTWMSPGSFSPFLYPQLLDLLNKVFIVQGNVPANQGVEIQLTPDASLIIPNGVLAGLLKEYERRHLEAKSVYTFLT